MELLQIRIGKCIRDAFVKNRHLSFLIKSVFIFLTAIIMIFLILFTVDKSKQYDIIKNIELTGNKTTEGFSVNNIVYTTTEPAWLKDNIGKKDCLKDNKKYAYKHYRENNRIRIKTSDSEFVNLYCDTYMYLYDDDPNHYFTKEPDVFLHGRIYYADNIAEPTPYTNKLRKLDLNIKNESFITISNTDTISEILHCLENGISPKDTIESKLNMELTSDFCLYADYSDFPMNSTD